MKTSLAPESVKIERQIITLIGTHTRHTGIILFVFPFLGFEIRNTSNLPIHTYWVI